jgi:hypothetical protein
MKNALTSEGLSEYQVYDAKYAEDLINFGLKNDSAEAISLGESMLQELQSTTSLNPQIKNWKMSNLNVSGTANAPTSTLKKFGKRTSAINIDDPHWNKVF